LAQNLSPLELFEVVVDPNRDSGTELAGDVLIVLAHQLLVGERAQILEELIRSPETNPTAKCTAIRTLMEIAPDPPVAGDHFADLDEDVLPMRPRHARTKRAENG
jgi:hypothetical protein